MSNIITTDGVSISLVPTGTDNVPTITDSDRIMEEKLSLQLWGEHFSGNLGMFTQHPGDKFSCSLDAGNGRHFCSFTLTKNPLGLVLLHQSPYDQPNYSCPLHLIPELQTLSLWSLLSLSSPYKTVQSAAYHLGEEPLGYSAFKLSRYHFCLGKFPVSHTKQYRTDISEETALQGEVNKIVDTGFPNGIFAPIPAFPNNMTSNWMVMCFDFTNEIDEVVQKVIKAYRILDAHHFVKCYLPLTHWYSKDLHMPFPATVGLPDKQILLHLPQIAKAEIVIVCSSLETALVHQQNNPAEEVVFTAFVCDDHRFDQVDFTPLKGKSVKLLISNHSGLTLAESYLEAQALYEYLREEVKIEEIGFIQMAVTYPDLTDVYDIDALMTAHRQEKPQIIDGSLLEMNEAEFAEMLVKATAEIERKHDQSQDKPFWQTPDSSALATEAAEPVPQKLTDKMILRPLIVGGQLTVIVGASGVGKSCFTTALCAQIAGSNAPFLKERCMTRCTPIDNPKRNSKVIYMIFDAEGVGLIEQHRKDFAGDLGENDCNFIQDDKSGEEIDYTQAGNYNKFVDLVNSYRNKGTPKQPVDVLVIDTLLEFAHNKVGKNLSEMLTRLLKDFPDMAIILIHHLNKKGDSFGGVMSEKLPRAILKLYRTDEQETTGRKATLHDPFTVKYDKFNANKIPVDGESFTVKLDEDTHFIVVDSAHTQEEMRKTLIEQYEKRHNLTQPEIGRLFGVSDRAIRDWK